MSEPKSCEWVDREPQYIKEIGGMRIDRSEWEGDKGAFFRYKETPCRLAADVGHKFCPKHELQASLEAEIVKGKEQKRKPYASED